MSSYKHAFPDDRGDRAGFAWSIIKMLLVLVGYLALYASILRIFSSVLVFGFSSHVPTKLELLVRYIHDPFSRVAISAFMLALFLQVMQPRPHYHSE